MGRETTHCAGHGRPTLDLPVDHDRGLAPRGAVGLLALATDQTVEHDLNPALRGRGLGLYVTRVPNADDISAATLRAMAPHLTRCTATLVPGAPLAAVAFACTSGSVLIGEAAVRRAVRRARPGVAVTTPITGAKAALSALGARRIALVAPYRDEVVAALIAHLEGCGVTVAAVGRLRQYSDAEACRATPDSLRRAAVATARQGKVDGVLISCTSLRAMPVIATCEAELGIPVIASNQVLAWHLLHLAGVEAAEAGPGRLFASRP